MSGYNMLLDCIIMGLFSLVMIGGIKLLNMFFPPFKKWFDKLKQGEL